MKKKPKVVNKVSEKITQLREANGWNKADLARKANVSPSLITKIENGTTKGSIATLSKIAEVLGVTLKDLL